MAKSFTFPLNITPMKIGQLFIILNIIALSSSSYSQDSSDLIYLDEDGALTYVPFAMSGQSNEVNTIPDFSYAGYMGGGVALPTDIPIQATVVPDSGDDTDRIQDAIDIVGAREPDQNGYRGVVLIKAGHYNLEGLLIIRESGVILRGEGQGLNGTVLHANPRTDHSVINVLGASGTTKDAESEQVITSGYVPVGSSAFAIADASGYQVGDQIVVTRTPNQKWIDDLGMDQESLCLGKAGCVGWTPSSYNIDHEREIIAISDDSIYINIPIVDVMEEQYGGGSITKIVATRRISQCGVENMRIQSFYDGNTDEDHAWTAVRIKDVEDSWVKQVTGQYLAYSTVNIESGNFITVQDCAYIDPKSKVTGGRRYSFAIQEGLGNLIQRCYAIRGRHDFVTGSRVAGPNVFLDGLAENASSDIGPHHRWATGNLFDNIGGGSTRVWNRGNSGTGHGWSGAQTMFWNMDSYSGEFRVDSPLGSINWGIGNVGSIQTGEGYWESWGNHVQPRSLYIQQLQDRLGEVAIDNILIPEQKLGEIYELLSTWAGQGDFSEGGFEGAIPTVSFINPTIEIDVSTWLGDDIELEADDSDGTVQSVILLINGEPVASDNTAPYVFSDLTSTIQALSHEVHYLQAIVTDNDGNTSTARVKILGGDPPLIEEEDESQLQIRVFPIPTDNGEITIEMIEDAIYTARILDMQGRLVDQFTFEGLSYQLSTAFLDDGIYILEINRDKESIFKGKVISI